MCIYASILTFPYTMEVGYDSSHTVPNKRHSDHEKPDCKLYSSLPMPPLASQEALASS
jgi:hypothetical protein